MGYEMSNTFYSGIEDAGAVAMTGNGTGIDWILIGVIVVSVILGIICGIILGKRTMKKRDI